MKKSYKSGLKLVGVLFWAVLAFSQNGLAVTKPESDPSKLDTSKIEAAVDTCDQTCGRIVATKSGAISEAGEKDIFTPSLYEPGKDWTTRDDALCGLIGQPTHSAYQITDEQKKSPVVKSACPVPLTNALVSELDRITKSVSQSPYRTKVSVSDNPTGLVCEKALDVSFRCMFKNSQLETQCTAYKRLRDTENMDYWIGALDLTAGGVCLGVCLTSGGVDPVLGGACSVASLTATGFETWASASIKQDSWEKIANTLLATGGGIASLGETAAFVVEKGFSVKEAGPYTKTLACVTSTNFFLSAALRSEHAIRTEVAKNLNCKNVTDLYSKSKVIKDDAVVADQTKTPNAEPTATFTSTITQNKDSQNVIAPAPGSGVTGSSSYQSIGTTVPGSGSNQTQTIHANSPFEREVKASLDALAADTKKAVDIGALNKSGLAKFAVPLSKQNFPDAPSAAAALKTPQSMLSAIHKMAPGLSGGAGGGSAGGLGSAMSQIKDAAKAASDAQGLSPADATYAGGGGSKAGSGGAQHSSPDFASLFGSRAPASGAGGGKETQFDLAAPDDIFHAKSTDNIFEIISRKVQQVTPRIK